MSSCQSVLLLALLLVLLSESQSAFINGLDTRLDTGKPSSPYHLDISGLFRNFDDLQLDSEANLVNLEDDER